MQSAEFTMFTAVGKECLGEDVVRDGKDVDSLSWGKGIDEFAYGESGAF